MWLNKCLFFILLALFLSNAASKSTENEDVLKASDDKDVDNGNVDALSNDNGENEVNENNNKEDRKDEEDGAEEGIKSEIKVSNEKKKEENEAIDQSENHEEEQKSEDDNKEEEEANKLHTSKNKQNDVDKENDTDNEEEINKEVAEEKNDISDIAVDIGLDNNMNSKRMYTGYHVLRVTPATNEHLQLLRLLSKAVSDVWTPIPKDVSKLVNTVDMLVSPDDLDSVTAVLDKSNVEYSVSIADLQRAIELENEVDVDDDEDELDLEDLLQGRQEEEPKKRYKRGSPLQTLLRSLVGLEPSLAGPKKVRKGRHFNNNNNGNKIVLKTVDNNKELPVITNSAKRKHISSLCTGRSGFDWRRYHRYSAMTSYLQCLSREHSDKAQLITIGYSTQNRPIHVLHIRKSSKIAKKAIWIDGGIHAREWISPAAVMYIAYQLTENYGETSHLLDQFDVFIAPVLNPDGYEYSHTHDRMWRKTRSGSGFGKCVGVDANRNWGHVWGGEGASDNPCTETYRGPSPFSEPETRAVRDFLEPRKGNIKMFLTFHSYGQFVLYPWGHTSLSLPPNHASLRSVANSGASAMLRRSGHRYTIGSAAQVLYPASGASDDWAMGQLGVEYSYTIELPDRGRHGFILPAHNVEEVAEETFTGVAAMIEEVGRN